MSFELQKAQTLENKIQRERSHIKTWREENVLPTELNEEL